MEHEIYMLEALKLASEAFFDGEIPVGCVIVKNNTIIGRGRNRREHSNSAIAHAEIEAIEDACRRMNSWRLLDCSMYVTLGPCPMCAGAIINARIPKIFYGAKDEKAGACGSVLNLFEERFNHRPQLVGGILRDECSAILTKFFKSLRTES